MRRNEKRTNKRERSEERGLRAYFLRLFGKYDIRDEKQFVLFGKWLILIVLVFLELLMLVQNLNRVRFIGWSVFFGLLSLTVVQTAVGAVNIFAVKNDKGRTVVGFLEMLTAGGFLFVADGTYPIIIYMLVLTKLYIGADKTLPSIAVLFTALPLYGASYALQIYLRFKGAISLFNVIMQSVEAVFALFAHYLIVQVALAFYRQFLRLDKALKELDASKKELEKAYEVVAEVTALEERQRIAKEIHDTAGHSLTTVIMQTEAAKLILPEKPEEAKKKIVSANLQAKHALEELRDSVHLLSGGNTAQTLKMQLENIVHESTDGTGITIRSEIDELSVSPTKARFLCNTLKEGISNGLRHGRATAFWFECKEEKGEICFLLSDNGGGVPLDKLRFGFGLTGMKDRAKSLGGEISFASEKDEGFEIHLRLPMDSEEK